MKWSPRRWTSSRTTWTGASSRRSWRSSDAEQTARPREPAHQGGGLDPPSAGAQGPPARLRHRDRGRDLEGPARGEGLRLGARRRGPVGGVAGCPRERPGLRPPVAAPPPRPPRHAGDRLPGGPLDGARRADPGSAAAAQRRRDVVSGAITLTDPAPSEAVLAPFGSSGGHALMLGHVHPDADVLGTLLALGLALEARGWRVTYGGPHPAPAGLAFLPGVERYRRLHALDGRFDVAVLTDCPNPARTEGLIDQAGAAPAFVSECLYERRAPDALRWLGEALTRVEVSDDGRLAWLILPAGSMPEKVIESEELVNYPRSVATVRVACLFRERDGQVKVSLRGKGDVDVQRIAAEFGGGGHPNAAGCTLAKPLAEATRVVLAAARAALAAAPGTGGLAR